MSKEIYEIGDTIASLYEVKEIFGGSGKSGMGVVYLVFHRERKKLYALKTIQERWFESRKSLLAFKREAEVWITLGKHPNIVQAINIRELEGRLYLVLEYVEPDTQGRNTLSHYLTGKPLSTELSLRWAIQFCDGMICANGRGLKCHRDIKPDNVMITKEGVLKITDFGLAKIIHTEGRKDTDTENKIGLGNYQMTTDSQYFKGTPEYAAPEAFEDIKLADITSDIYSFGIVLYQMLSGGELPFKTERCLPDYRVQLYGHLHRTQQVPTLGSPLFPIVQKCLAKSKSERFPDFGALRNELEGYYKKTWSKSPQVTKNEETPEDIRCFAQSLFEIKRYDVALKKCNEALLKHPADYEAWDLKGRICFHLNRERDALTAFEKSIEIKHDYWSPWNNKGMVFRKIGKVKDAIDCFRKAISLRPTYREAWNNLGVCAYQQEDFLDAIKHYKKAIDCDSKYRDVWLNIGDCFIRLKQYNDAINCYKKAVEIDPHDPYTWENLSKLYQILGMETEAQRASKKFLEINKGFSH